MPVRYTVREVLRLISRDGWTRRTQTGSHRQFTHETKRGRVTVAGKPGDTFHPKTAASIFRQAQITP